MLDLTTLRTGSLLEADIIVSPKGTTSREVVEVVRLLDWDTVLVKVRSMLGTPDLLLGAVLPVESSRVVRAL